ncbi:hypothetical protein GWK47_001602 [Chionoecetes opilio]|uniref:Uncharacterized protein n=1 Tax=Chionoecetes opilio TaxID=41210 RepID=A0A8J4Y3T2_CHIOP|nr:hypothetical protein GWK47_001602 [Chionoecetes opilio]
MATQNSTPLMVDGRVVDFQASGTVLGLQVSSRGYVSHMTSRVRRAKSALFTLYRFRDLDAGLRLHLVKALFLPVLTYPPIPLHALSRTAISRLQRVQNAALRFVVVGQVGRLRDNGVAARVRRPPSHQCPSAPHGLTSVAPDARGRLGAVSGPAGTQRRGPGSFTRVVPQEPEGLA